MSPALKVLRAMLLLPVREAEDREARVVATQRDVTDKRENAAALDQEIGRKSKQLRETYDRLLGRTTWPF